MIFLKILIFYCKIFIIKRNRNISIFEFGVVIILDEKGRLFFSMDITFNNQQFDSRWEYNTSCPVHIHSDYYEILFVTRGSYTNIFQGETESVPAGTILLYNVGTVHEFNSTCPLDSHFIFAGQKDYFNQYMALHFPNVNLFSESPYMKISLSAAQEKYMLELAQLSGHPEHGKHFISLFLYNVIALVQISYDTPNPICDEYVFDIIEKINNLTYLNTPVTSIYKSYPISSTYLIKMFELRTGMGIKKFQNKRKLEYSANLLAQTDKSITEIAGEIGIDSLSHFINLFKRTYGITPSQYRKRSNYNVIIHDLPAE